MGDGGGGGGESGGQSGSAPTPGPDDSDMGTGPFWTEKIPISSGPLSPYLIIQNLTTGDEGDGLPVASGYTIYITVSAPYWPGGNKGHSFLSCTFTGKIGFSYLSTALDAVGVIPGAGNVLHGVQFGAALVSTGLSVFGDATGAGLAATGQGLALVEKSATNITVHGVEVVPIVGNVVSGVSVLFDVFGKEGLIANYKSCMAGKN